MGPAMRCCRSGNDERTKCWQMSSHNLRGCLVFGTFYQTIGLAVQLLDAC